MSEVSSSEICQSEHCNIEGIHLAHQVRAKRDKKPRCSLPPWLIPAPSAIDESIERALVHIGVASFSSLMDEVQNDYGSLGPTQSTSDRTLHRHLASLCHAGRVLRVDVGGRLYAYMTPTSRLRFDLDLIRETLLSLIDRRTGLIRDGARGTRFAEAF